MGREARATHGGPVSPLPIERPYRRVIRLIRAAWLLAMIVAASLVATDVAASRPTTTAVQVTTTGAPQRVHGSDGREHIEFNLVTTNSFTTQVTLTSLVVRGGGRRLLRLGGDALAAATHPIGGGNPTANIPSSGTVATPVDVVLPRSAGRAVPKRAQNRITYTFPPDAPSGGVIGSKTVHGPDLRVDRRRPIEIAPPLRGAGWLNANGCCDDPTAPHRSTILSANGGYVAPETFAIDYVRIADGRLFEGDGTENADWFGYGAPIRAVAAGTVVSAVNGRPEIPPFSTNPFLRRPFDYGGNGVVVKVRRNVFVHYYHLQPGSVHVKAGERVRTGQELGLLGNSGNTDAPHLHFSINEGPSPLASTSLPYEIDRFRLEGTAAAGQAPGEVTVTGAPQDERRSYPLVTSVSDYSR